VGGLGRRLKRDGNYVVVADWKKNEFMTEAEFCDEFMLVDLRELSNCIK
jgi:GDP-D-mannose 3', 5'-epimerase